MIDEKQTICNILQRECNIAEEEYHKVGMYHAAQTAKRVFYLERFTATNSVELDAKFGKPRELKYRVISAREHWLDMQRAWKFAQGL